MARPKTYATILERLEANTAFIPFSGCYVWLGTVHKTNGHGIISFRLPGLKTPRSISVHRLAWNLSGRKRVPLLRHLCNVDCCWRPDHLIPGTQKENVMDQILNGTNINQIRWKKQEQKNKQHMRSL